MHRMFCFESDNESIFNNIDAIEFSTSCFHFVFFAELIQWLHNAFLRNHFVEDAGAMKGRVSYYSSFLFCLGRCGQVSTFKLSKLKIKPTLIFAQKINKIIQRN